MSGRGPEEGLLTVSGVLSRTGRQLLEESPVVLVSGAAATSVSVPAALLLPRLPAVLVCILAFTEAVAAAGCLLHERDAGRRAGEKRFAALRRAALDGLFLSAVYAALVLIVYSVWAFQRAQGGLALLILALFQSYVAFVVAASQLYVLPLCAVRGMAAPRALVVGMKILFENPGYSAVALLQVAAGSVVLAVTLIGLPLVWPGAFAAFGLNLTANILGRYEACRT